ncbi:MAG: glycosyltransferase [Anaerolineae bacterium]|nr:glycosyltransferase [Anaerolineae bacterium]
MRVIHICKVTGVAGAENHLLTLLAGLRGQEIDARLLLLVEPGNPVETMVAAATSRGIPAERSVIRADIDPILLIRLVRRLRTLQPDIVHTHLFHADLHGIPAARLAGVPRVVSSRHNDNTFRRRFPYRQINRCLWRLTTAGIGISAAITRFAIEVEGASPAQMTTIPYGLPSAGTVDRAAARAALRAELGLPPDALLAGLVCRLIEQKGIPYALRAFARVADRFPNAHLVIAGDGPLRNDLEAQARDRGLAERVRFLGWRTDTAAIFAALDVFLMPSLWEGFGLVLLEAMAQGVPVIGSAVSAIPEVVADGETGLLCPPRDVDCLAAALGDLLADPGRRARLGAAGRARLEERFSSERMVAETIALYERLMAVSKPTGS